MNLDFKIQKYDWGKLGSSSAVAQLARAARSDFEIQEDVPYAELWMGTHPNGPSIISSTGQDLSEHVAKHPECLGAKVVDEFGGQLPFLFKVLSVAKALSVQAHPNKSHAEHLHRTWPHLYKDPNHKPELAIALTPFEAMCGFRPVQEIRRFLQNVPELVAAVGGDNADRLLVSDEAGLAACLRDCFKCLMTRPAEWVAGQLEALLARLAAADEVIRAEQLAALVERLHSQFPGDVGCFTAYFLNLLHLSPGQALYLGPNEPHAYLSGDCVECMACSDNVVRAGLTPKFKDVDTLCDMLSYSTEPAAAKLFTAATESSYSQLYAPPVKDFAVARVELAAGASSTDLVVRSSASVVLVVSGEANADAGDGPLALHEGSVYFLPGGALLRVENVTSRLLMFQAFANV